LGFKLLASPKRVREATYIVVFAALKTVSNNAALRNPGSPGICDSLTAIMRIDDPERVSWLVLVAIDGREGSCHDTFK
jgi:hypothetical protein